MRNIEKWDKHIISIQNKTKEFLNSLTKGINIPEKYYYVYPTGKIAERFIIDFEYSHYKHGVSMYFNGKNPKNKDVDCLKNYDEGDIPFDINNMWFKYSEDHGTFKSTSSVPFTDLINQKGIFYSKSDAEKQAEKIALKNEEEKLFREKHKKDRSYDYVKNGYKFLGWQNGWKHTYFDEDGNDSEKTGKPRKSFGYKKEDYPEYGKCLEEQHRRIEVQHNQRGSENTVSCPKCKIYWKYDSSD